MQNMKTTQKEKEEKRLVIAFQEEDDFNSLLEIALDCSVRAPLRISKEELEKEYDNITLPSNIAFDNIFLFSSRSRDKLSRFVETIKSNNEDVFISSFF